MDPKDFTIIGAWRSVAEGQVYEAQAKTKAGRIIARTNAYASLDTAADLDKMLGATGRKAVEDSVNETCRQLALKFPG